MRDSELASLEMAVRSARRDGAPDEAQRLEMLRDRLLAAMPSSTPVGPRPTPRRLLEAGASPHVPVRGW